MKNLTLLLLTVVVFSSCRKDFASFQKSSNQSYSQKKKVQNSEIQINVPEPILEASIKESEVFFEQKEIISIEISENESNKPLFDDDRKRKKRKNVSEKEGTLIHKIFPNLHPKDKKTTKKSRKPVPLNSTIYTGFIILGIAILLALVSLNSLSLLFGVASIVFLYFGFKRYFRRKRRRDIFR
ncbi:hypothetical protein EMA8858_00752 [Emticicia aquatica]|uniref:Lipoprotein n=1 Tax=Emticicia aquatica TaxID=1681835 RepID=A0ABM9AM01_9BACT|nr:hypothetical protein [Emticicia aquatica]CAH0994640.1 hypothetical protein EMA8858_00752 [Emticicia aquatica]